MAFHFLLAATTSAASPVTLHILPHTHADVGWLQTVNSLSRLNVSRILDGVVATLQQDERRRFVWDEMAFLQLWWDANSTSDRQRTAFRQLVLERRIEMVDNGWSQHDMGCTTVDSMLNNWVEGHSWIAQHFGSEFLPRVGWSLDPFGPSVSQAVLQAMMGMDAWFFTRITGSDVDARKEAKALEFVWRGSSSLPHEETEIFSHVFESYYCMPHEYQFEWWADAIPNASTIVSRSWALANLTLERAAWFRTPNVLIPWGCDYMYQNAPLTFGSTEWLIDTINNHTTEWGVVAKFVTASEYVDAVLASAAASARDATAAVAPAPSFGLPVEASAELAAGNLSEAAQAANVSFPTVKNGSTFFPYEDWSGYFTSRPYLKGLSQRVHTALSAAEQLFGLHGSALDASSRRKLYARLETARRNGAIYQHHDAITGTFCAYAEGCAGEDQDVGSHDVLGSYEYMLEAALDEARTVFAAVAAATVHESGAAVVSTGSASTAANGANAAAPPLYFTDTQAFGDLLMGDGTGGGDAELLLYNPHAHAVVEGVSVPVPLCAVALYDLDSGEAVPSQTTATLQVNAGIAPSFDFELSFLAALPPLAFKRYLVSPVRDALGSAYYGHGCPASSSVGAAASVSHVQIHGKRPRPCASSDSPSADTCRDERKAAPPPPPPPALVSLENAFVRVDLDPTKGVVGVFDKAAGEFYPLTVSSSRAPCTFAHSPRINFSAAHTPALPFTPPLAFTPRIHSPPPFAFTGRPRRVYDERRGLHRRRARVRHGRRRQWRAARGCALVCAQDARMPRVAPDQELRRPRHARATGRPRVRAARTRQRERLLRMRAAHRHQRSRACATAHLRLRRPRAAALQLCGSLRAWRHAQREHGRRDARDGACAP